MGVPPFQETPYIEIWWKLHSQYWNMKYVGLQFLFVFFPIPVALRIAGGLWLLWVDLVVTGQYLARSQQGAMAPWDGHGKGCYQISAWGALCRHNLTLAQARLRLLVCLPCRLPGSFLFAFSLRTRSILIILVSPFVSLLGSGFFWPCCPGLSNRS